MIFYHIEAIEATVCPDPDYGKKLGVHGAHHAVRAHPCLWCLRLGTPRRSTRTVQMRGEPQKCGARGASRAHGQRDVHSAHPIFFLIMLVHLFALPTCLRVRNRMPVSLRGGGGELGN
jgi:hypothetical protein